MASSNGDFATPLALTQQANLVIQGFAAVRDIQNNGVTVDAAGRSKLNLIAADDVTLSFTDEPVSDRVTVTIGAATNQLAYQEFTGSVSVTATTEATANTLVTAAAVTFDGSTKVNIEFFAPLIQPDDTTAGNAIFLVLYDGSTRIGQLASATSPSTASALDVTVFAARQLTPSAATKTYSVRAYVSTGTGVVSAGAGGAGAYMPGFIKITRVI